MTETLLIVAIVLSIGLCLAAVFSLPRWLFTSLNRGCMWHLRDDISLDVVTGNLPRESPTHELILRVEKGISFAHLLSPASLRRIENWIDEAGLADEPDFGSLGGLKKAVQGWPRTECQRYEAYVARFEFLLRRQYFTGSWPGIFKALWFGGRALLPLAVSKATLWREPVRQVVPERSTRPGLVQVSLWGVAFEIPERSEAARQATALDDYVDCFEPPSSDDPASALTPV